MMLSSQNARTVIWSNLASCKAMRTLISPPNYKRYRPQPEGLLYVALIPFSDPGPWVTTQQCRNPHKEGSGTRSSIRGNLEPS
jgi:hypothetical protein